MLDSPWTHRGDKIVDSAACHCGVAQDKLGEALVLNGGRVRNAHLPLAQELQLKRGSEQKGKGGRTGGQTQSGGQTQCLARAHGQREVMR